MCAQCKALEPQRLPERKTKCRREATEPNLNPNPGGSCGMRPGRVGDSAGADSLVSPQRNGSAAPGAAKLTVSGTVLLATPEDRGGTR